MTSVNSNIIDDIVVSINIYDCEKVWKVLL